MDNGSAGANGAPTRSTVSENLSPFERRLWLMLAGSALAAGVYFRFLGFGRWPFAIDEYYVYRAITFVLSSGLPEFPCGGYYARGLLYQYVTAPLLACGLPPEASLRFVTIVCNFAMLPAAYLLARRMGGFRVAAATLTILALSTWEVEMARFGRMYAPFQAVFVWYAYHAYRLIETADQRRWRWLLGLSIAAPLVWEGGVMLGLFNFLPVLMRRALWKWSHVCVALVILGLSVALLQIDFRHLGSTDAQTPATAEVSGASAETGSSALLASRLTEAPVLAVAFVLLAALLVGGLFRAARTYGPRSTVSTIAVAASVLVSQIGPAVLLLLGALLVGWLRPRDLSRREGRLIWSLLLAISVIWILVALGVGPESVVTRLLPLIGRPDLVYSIAYPWFMTMPLMTALLGVGGALALAIGLSGSTPETLPLRMLLAIVFVSAAVVGAAQTAYVETRYSFHMFPILVILALFAFNRMIVGSGHAVESGRWAPLACLALFAVSSDFALGHMSRIDSYEANFRVGYHVRRIRHYYPRLDFKAPADYVNRNAGPSDLIITTNVVVAQYLARTDFVYLERDDSRYRGQACDLGARERWTGLPLLDSVEDVEALVRSTPSSRFWLIVDEQTANRRLPQGYLAADGAYELAFTAQDGRVRVYRRAPAEGAR